RHTRFSRDWSSDVCSSDLDPTRHTTSPGAPQLTRAALTRITHRRALSNPSHAALVAPARSHPRPPALHTRRARPVGSPTAPTNGNAPPRRTSFREGHGYPPPVPRSTPPPAGAPDPTAPPSLVTTTRAARRRRIGRPQDPDGH